MGGGDVKSSPTRREGDADDTLRNDVVDGEGEESSEDTLDDASLWTSGAGTEDN